jgi:hypothetical protein
VISKSTELCRKIVDDIRAEIERRTAAITPHTMTMTYAEGERTRQRIEGLMAAITIVENRARHERMPKKRSQER